MARSDGASSGGGDKNKRSILQRVRPRAAKVRETGRDVDAPTIPDSNGATTADWLLDKWAIEERTSLDITTIYRKIKIGTFPAPLRVGLRRVAWRESDVAAWQDNLVVGVSRG